MASEITDWLARLGLDKYGDVFAENEISMAALPHITEADLREIGIPLGPRRQILAAMADLEQAAGAQGQGQAIDSAPKAAAPSAQTANGQNTVDAETGKPDASRRQVTVLFSDISGYTSLTNSMDAEDIHAMLNRYFEVVGTIVNRYGGTVDKHIGDAVMAVFGATKAHTDDPERAVRAACDIHKAVAALSPPIPVHVGIAAGQVVASATGSTEHNEYTVIGDSVNLAARLTDLAETNQTLISASVRRALADRFEGEALGEQVIAGLPEPVHVWRVSSLAEPSGFSRRAFVGRQQERETFESAVKDCLAGGGGQTLIVRGEAGIGKTRLLEEGEQIADGQGMVAHTGLVLDFGTAEGQDAVGALVRSLLGLVPDSSVEQRKAALDRTIETGVVDEPRRVFMNDLLDLDQEPALRGLYDTIDNEARNRGKHETVTSLVANASKQQPLLLKFEDLHWADSFVKQQVAHLARMASDCQIVQLLTTRLSGDQLDKDWKDSCGDARIEVLDLQPMSNENALEIGRGFEDISDEMLRNCIERSGGNPLFLEQLLHNVDATSQGELPGTVQGIVQARVDALPDWDRRALQAASALGQRFSFQTVNAMIDKQDYQPDELLRQSLIRPAGTDYHFAHALIRDGVYSSLLKPRRIDLHQRAADFFKETAPVLYAEHLDQAKNEIASKAYLAAARIQHDGFRFETALRLVRRALELNPAFELMCFEGELLRDLGESAKSIEAYERALLSAETDEERCQAHIGKAAGMRITNQTENALACLQAAETIALKRELSHVLAELNALRGNLFFPRGRIEECLKANEASLKYARECGSPEAEARALGGLGDANYASGKMRTAQDFFARCVTLSEQHGLPRIEVANRPMWSWTTYFRGELKPSEDMGFIALERVQETGNIRAELIAHDVLSEIFFQIGEHDKSKHHGLQLLKLTRSIGSTLFEALGSIIIGRWHLYSENDPKSAFATFVEGFEYCKATSESFLGPWLLGCAALAAGDEQERKWALSEGERILKAGAVSHNFFFFYANAMEVSRLTENWPQVHHYADALDRYTVDERLEWSDFYMQRARLLARHGTGERGKEIESDLLQLLQQAEASHFQMAKHAIQQALHELGAIQET